MNPNIILAHWNRLGISFNVQPSEQTADIELLIVETAPNLAKNARLLPAVASWLCKYHRLVCRHRLAKLVGEIDAPEILAALGFMLSSVKEELTTDHFNVAIKRCKKLQKPTPLFEVDRKSKGLAILAKSNSCDLAGEWGLWCNEIEFRYDIICEPMLVIRRNPALKYRALFSGQLKASVLETITNNPQSANSEVALANACGVTRKALRKAVEHLEFCQLVERNYVAGKINIHLTSQEIYQDHEQVNFNTNCLPKTKCPAKS